MDRRAFLRSLGLLGAATVAGCKSDLVGPANSKVVLAPPDGPGGGGGDNRHIGLYVTADNVTQRYHVPWQPGMTVRQALDWARTQTINPLDVRFGSNATYGSYVDRLLGHAIDAESLPTWLYAKAPHPLLTEAAWYEAVAGRYIDTELAPPIGGVIDWRLAVP